MVVFQKCYGLKQDKIQEEGRAERKLPMSRGCPPSAAPEVSALYHLHLPLAADIPLPHVLSASVFTWPSAFDTFLMPI